MIIIIFNKNYSTNLTSSSGEIKLVLFIYEYDAIKFIVPEAQKINKFSRL